MDGRESQRRLRIPAALAFAAVALPLLLAASALTSRPPAPPDPRAAYDLVRVGMTATEVEAILGGWPGKHGTAGTPRATAYLLVTDCGSHRCWWGFPDCTVAVGFQEGRVDWKRIEPEHPPG